LTATPAESEAPGAQINSPYKKSKKRLSANPNFFGFVDSLKRKVALALLFLAVLNNNVDFLFR
ncbi:hypothetical protein, partial [Neobacillus dielmonensis]|uniref:hypothetical protein n=1 Tax=Neobacillus dielmonensis TaxID=1347369 RepID=UPI0005A69A75